MEQISFAVATWESKKGEDFLSLLEKSPKEAIFVEQEGRSVILAFLDPGGVEKAFSYLKEMREGSSHPLGFRAHIDWQEGVWLNQKLLFLGKYKKEVRENLKTTPWGSISFHSRAKKQVQRKYSFQKKGTSFYLLARQSSSFESSFSLHPSLLSFLLSHIQENFPSRLWIHLVGEPGIGKSFLLKTLETLLSRLDWPVVRFVLTPHPQSLLREFRRSFPKVHPSISLENFAPLWHTLPPPLLLLDNYDVVSQKEKSSLYSMFQSLPMFLISTGLTPLPYPEVRSGFFEPLPLATLKQYLRSFPKAQDLSPKDFSRLLEKTLGNPRLAKRLLHGRDFTKEESEVLQYRFQSLSLEEKKALWRASLLGNPFSLSLFERLFPSHLLYLQRLKGKFFSLQGDKGYFLYSRYVSFLREIPLQLSSRDWEQIVKCYQGDSSFCFWEFLLKTKENPRVVSLVKKYLGSLSPVERQALLEKAESLFPTLSEQEKKILLQWKEKLKKVPN